jgi:formate hydrogenlyase subunit 4
MIMHYIIDTLFFLLAPIFAFGIMRKFLGRAQGRKGAPILQVYYDILRMFKKSPVDGPNTQFFGIVSPVFCALSMILLWIQVVWEIFPIVIIPFLLAFERFFIIGYATETGTSFGGFGSSKTIHLSVFTEPILFGLILIGGSHIQFKANLEYSLFAFIFFCMGIVVLLTEVSLPPFDDPRTHLELTMTHEAMLLEASGYRLAFFEVSRMMKLISLMMFLVDFFMEHTAFIYYYLDSQILISIVKLFMFFFLMMFLSYWQTIISRRKWSWIPEMLGLSLLFMILVGTIMKLNLG